MKTRLLSVIAIVAIVLAGCYPAPKPGTADTRPSILVSAFRGIDREGQGYYSPNRFIPSEKGELVSFDYQDMHMLLRVRSDGVWVLESNFEYTVEKNPLPLGTVFYRKNGGAFIRWTYLNDAKRWALLSEYEGNVLSFVGKK